MSPRTWQVTASVVFPTHVSVDVDDKGKPQFPEKLTPQSRFPVGHRQVDGADVYVLEGDKWTVPQIKDDLRFDVAAVAVRLESPAEDPFTATTNAAPFFDRVLESFAFQMQTALQIQSVRAIDLTGSPSVGDEREFATWSGYGLPTFRPTSVPVQSLVGRLVPDLNQDLDPRDPRANRALDWYLKALTAQFEADHFIFLWIACEILAADSDLKVSEPYRGPHCGHVIEECPECGSPTTKPVQGASMKRWLTDGFDVREEVANRVWKARQVLHGAYEFDSEVMDTLPELSQWLRHAIVTELKRRLGMAPNEPPFALAEGLTISPYMGASGTAKVTERDLNPIS